MCMSHSSSKGLFMSLDVGGLLLSEVIAVPKQLRQFCNAKNSQWRSNRNISRASKKNTGES